MKYKTTITRIYNVTKCPFCGNELSRWEQNPYMENFGNPIVQCKKCGKIVLDNNIKEMAIRPWQWYIDRQHKEPSILLKALVFGWLPALGILFFIRSASSPSTRSLISTTNGERTFYILLILSFAAYVAGIIVFYTKGLGRPYVISGQFKKEYEESEKRLSDPAYRELLARTGYIKPADILTFNNLKPDNESKPVINSETGQKRSEPKTEAGKALRVLYDRYGAEKLLTDSALMVNGFRDLVNDSKNLKEHLRLATEAGIGKEYLEQIRSVGKMDEAFANRIRKALSEEVGLSDAVIEELTGYFDEMIGWK